MEKQQDATRSYLGEAAGVQSRRANPHARPFRGLGSDGEGREQLQSTQEEGETQTKEADGELQKEPNEQQAAWQATQPQEQRISRTGEGVVEIAGLRANCVAEGTGVTEGENDLRDVVMEQQKEIMLLRQRLSALGASPDTDVEQVNHVSVGYALSSQSSPRPAFVDIPTNESTGGIVGDQAITLAFPALLRGLTDKSDVRNVHNMCQTIVGDGLFGEWEVLFKSFYEEVVACRDALTPEVIALESSLPADWYTEPWYLLYVQWMGVEEGEHGDAGFDNLCRMLPYIRDNLGFRNICLLPHYESPMGDGGYDVSDFITRSSLGGEEAFERFMKTALHMGLRVATDAVFNHTSTEHPWFQKALSGDEKYVAYYVQRNGREKIGEWDRNGDIVCRYRDPDGTITERVVVFPDIDRTHGLWVEINGKTYQFYRSFFPFQVDLNLQNPDVLCEVFRILGREVRQGVLGKRMDAIAHWIKKPGCASEGLPECHAVQALLKSFLRHVNRRAIIMPEVVRDLRNAATYSGMETKINGTVCASEGDAILCFEMQAALREMTYFQTVAPYWQRVFRIPSLHNGTWLNLLEHHDETFMGFFGAEVRAWLAEYIKTHGGIMYKNGMSAGARIADCLNNDAERIATALFILYITPGTPLIYAGTELGWRSNYGHADTAADCALQTFQTLGVYAERQACYDARELQRGPIPRVAFTKAVETKYAPLEMVRTMNEIRMRRTWLNEPEAHPLDSGDVGVLCMGRAGGSERVICVANLTGSTKLAVVPRAQVEGLWGSLEGTRVEEIWGGDAEVADAGVRICVQEYGRAVVRIGG